MLIQKTITIGLKKKRRTCIRLDEHHWHAVNDICDREKCSTSDLISLIDAVRRHDQSLVNAVRIYTMLYYKAAATEDGHQNAFHGNIKSFLKKIQRKDSPLDIT